MQIGNGSPASFFVKVCVDWFLRFSPELLLQADVISMLV